MNPEIFAEWIRRQGHKVYHTESSYWYEAGPRVLQAFPYHWQIRPSHGEIRSLMTRHVMFSLRYSAPLNFPEGKISYHIVLEKPYHLDLLKAQARNGVKRGLSRCKIGQISFERLASEGWVLQQDTLDRQNRSRSMTRLEWERICRSAIDLPGFEAWGAMVDHELAAALIVCQIDRIWDVPYALCHRKFLHDHVNNALFYTVSCNLLARENVDEIFFTVQSLDAPSTVDDFKLRMNLIPRPVRQRVDFHPWLKPLINRNSHKLSVHLLRRHEGNPLIAKAEGMMRFHLEGRLPPALQQWPECLTSHREEITNCIGGAMTNLDGCQIPNLPRMTEGTATVESQPLIRRLKRYLAMPWNYVVKRGLKYLYHTVSNQKAKMGTDLPPANFSPGEVVRIRTLENIRSTLDPFNELKGCAFLPEMEQYCGTARRVLQVMERFLDERDYRVKKVRGIVLLDGVICHGTPVFGRCDRCCHLFWRTEWLEKPEA